MARWFHHNAGWRRFGAALAAFGLGAQLALSGLLIGGLAGAADEADGWIVCSHHAATADESGSGSPQAPKHHDECPACTCAQSAKLTPTLPAPPLLAVLRGRSEIMPLRPVAAVSARHSPSPYSSRAPPSCA